MKEVKKTIYITKYALTQGVIKCDAKIKSNGNAYGKPDGWMSASLFFEKEFEYSIEDAESSFEELKNTKLRSLEKQIEKVKKSTFKMSKP